MLFWGTFECGVKMALRVHNYSTGGNEFIQNLSGVSLNVIFSLSVFYPPTSLTNFGFVFFCCLDDLKKIKRKKVC